MNLIKAERKLLDVVRKVCFYETEKVKSEVYYFVRKRFLELENFNNGYDSLSNLKYCIDHYLKDKYVLSNLIKQFEY